MKDGKRKGRREKEKDKSLNRFTLTLGVGSLEKETLYCQLGLGNKILHTTALCIRNLGFLFLLDFLSSNTLSYELPGL